ncbi:ribonuclease P protein subunit [Candidatus Woesearchaeota archaeon]|nr:ribonuclease P protein subunit [Candidatus Woesearchaeota archaeon]
MKDLAKKELIGVEAEIIDSVNKSNIGIKGRIIDETKNCITIMTDKGEKKMIKNNITLNISEKKARIQGKDLSGRPEERIKKKLR